MTNQQNTQTPSNPIDEMYKANLRQSLPPSCRVDTKTLKKLLETLNQSCREAANREIAALKKEAFNESDYQRIVENILKGYEINIEVIGAKGEYFASTKRSILDDDKLPEIVNRITFDSAFTYKSIFKSAPPDSVRIVLDFHKPPLFDFVSNPSFSTRNDSLIEVVGRSDSWVNGVHEMVVQTLKDRATKRAWLHKQSIYDLFLWFFVLPLSIWNLHKFLSTRPMILQNLSGVLSVFVFIYFFVLVLFSFRAFFNYSRWLFPYVELETTAKTISSRHRVFFSGLTIFLVYGLVQDFIFWIFRKLFQG
jgi:hypothetical protein